MIIVLLKEWLSEQKGELVSQTVSLISEDAPKNKFSIVSGKMKMIEDVEAEIKNLERKQQETQGMRQS